MKNLTEHTRDLLLALAAGILGVVFVLLMGCATTLRPIERAILIEVPEMTVIIMPPGTVTHEGRRVEGLAVRMEPELLLIMVEGWLDENNLVIVKNEKLGHELKHHLHWINAGIKCPDEEMSK